MNRRIVLLFVVTLALAILSGCGNGIDKLPGSSTGALTVQFAQSPPTPTIAGQSIALVANALNDSKNGGVSWSCAPAGACGTFNPAKTAYNVGTLYTPPVAPANGPITQNLAYPVTITATSVSDNSKSSSTTLNIAQQYAFVIAGYASYGMVGSVILDGNGNVTGETDYSANGGYGNFPITGTYTLDATTGYGTMTWNMAGCCPQTNAITATSNSHLTMSEVDQFAGLTFGGTGSMDLQSGPFSASQLSGGYSFTTAGYDAAQGFNGSWGGVFTADGVGNITNGVFDTSLGGGASGFSSTNFTGTFTAPDSNGRGLLDLNNGASYVYYMVNSKVLRITTVNDSINKSTVQNAANTGTAFAQGSLATSVTNAALTGNFVFGDFGFADDNNGGEQSAAAGQFTTDGAGNITSGVMDLNAFGTVSTISLAGSTYGFGGSPRGSLTGPAGQVYLIYATDPTLNLLDPNNPTGNGGALLLEADAGDTIGVIVPQTDTSATLSGGYAFIFSNQSNPPNADGGFDAQFSAAAGAFSGQGAYQGESSNSLIPIIGPLSGTFTADASNPGRFTGSITTTPPLWSGSIGDTTPGTQNVSYYLANGAQGFVVETDSTAPAVGTTQLQSGLQTARKNRQSQSQRRFLVVPNQAVDPTRKFEILRRSR